ncbi:MAG TPA: hypothetical protein VEL50_07705 [Gemmatimonadales bacterium]|nr:hypothetical protein [Gemmatimonadales bacterium]
MLRTALVLVFIGTALPAAGVAQRGFLGAGILLGDFPSEPAFDLHLDSPPLYRTRAELTLSWNDKSAKPTVITEAERSIIDTKALAVDVGAGLLWLEANEYRPYPAIISTIVVPVPVPRLAFVVIPDVQPFQDFEWALVLKVSLTLWSRR